MLHSSFAHVLKTLLDFISDFSTAFKWLLTDENLKGRPFNNMLFCFCFFSVGLLHQGSMSPFAFISIKGNDHDFGHLNLGHIFFLLLSMVSVPVLTKVLYVSLRS
jgi:hypothetical protein